jgi:hypothetical protein
VKIFLFALVVYFLYVQVQKFDFDKFKSIKIINISFFILGIILLVLNWFFEFLKWNEIIQITKIKVERKIKVKSFLAGILTGFLTPNLLGNFIGRIYYFPRRERIELVYLTFFSNAAQFFASIIFGLISILIIGFPDDFKIDLSGIIVSFISLLILICLIFYFNLGSLCSIFFKNKKWFSRINFNEESTTFNFNFQFKQLIISFLRHGVFSFQYFLMLTSFGIKADFVLILLIWQVFFWSTLIPSLWLGKLGIRESMALWILGAYTNQLEIVLCSSLILWFVNQGITAIIAFPFFKLVTKKND